MVGEFMVCVDKIIASACLNAGGEVVSGATAGNRCCAPAAVEGQEGCSGSRKEIAKYKKTKKGGCVREVVECRICQEEGDESDMENPCACNGTLKFAHRRCIQRWCSKKGNITCEICNKVYAPNYYAPPPAAGSDVLAIDIRESWGARIDLHDSHFLAITPAEQEFLHAEYEEYAAAHNSGIACCRAVSLILMMLLLSRQILMVTSDPMMVQDVSAFVNVSLQFISILLPCYVIARMCCLLQSWWKRQARL